MAVTDDSFFRVLYVDDNSLLHQPMKMGLGAYGFEVMTACHGIDALMQFKMHKGRFGTVITDHDMPQMNGLELARCLRNLGYAGRIVVVSGRLRVEDLHAYQEFAITGFLHKPFEAGKGCSPRFFCKARETPSGSSRRPQERRSYGSGTSSWSYWTCSAFSLAASTSPAKSFASSRK